MRPAVHDLGQADARKEEVACELGFGKLARTDEEVLARSLCRRGCRASEAGLEDDETEKTIESAIGAESVAA